MVAVTLPALSPVVAATAVVVVGAGGLSVAPASGAPLPPPRATHPPASHLLPAVLPAVALPAEPGATAARGHGAGQAGLAASSVAGATSGAERSVGGGSRAPGRSGAGSVRIRAPPR
jgi:hypothetical protein